jgi:putative ABC transport system permease protein
VPEADIGWAGLGISLLLVAVALAISQHQNLALGRSIAWASARAIAQLMAVGYALKIVIDPDAPIALAWLWVVAMVGFAAITIRQRAPEVPSIFVLALAAMGASAAVSLTVIFGLGVFPVEGRTIVPLAGMMIGNSMSSTVVAARRIVGELSDKRAEVEARASHSASRGRTRLGRTSVARCAPR